MQTQQIIRTKAYKGEGDCACGAQANLFVAEYSDEYGDITGDYPSLLQCKGCIDEFMLTATPEQLAIMRELEESDSDDMTQLSKTFRTEGMWPIDKWAAASKLWRRYRDGEFYAE